MKRLFRFRTGRLGSEQLPDLPKTARKLRFVGGLAVGTVAAVTVFGGGASNRNVLAMVDASESMAGRDVVLAKHLAQLQRKGISPIIVRTVGFGIHPRPGGLLQSLENAVALNPSVRTVYVFSDFSCESAAYDRDEQASLDRLATVLGSRQFFLGSVEDPPGQKLVGIASDGGWIDKNGNLIQGGGAQAGTGTVAGIVRNAEDGTVLKGARITVGSHSAESDDQGHFRIRGVTAGQYQLMVAYDGLVPTTVDSGVRDCQVLTENLSLSKKLEPGELRVTLNWQRMDGKPNDLDLHFIHLSRPGEHIFYGNREIQGANLQIDNIKAEGDPPTETIHISSKLPPDAYALDVCDFENEIDNQGIARSHAVVQIFGPDGLVKTFQAPQQAGRRWRVFTIDPQDRMPKEVGHVDTGEGLEGCLTNPRQ